MALIKCPECRAKVSDKAATCPKCGFAVADWAEAEYKNKALNKDGSTRKFIGYLLVVVLVLIGVKHYFVGYNGDNGDSQTSKEDVNSFGKETQDNDKTRPEALIETQEEDLKNKTNKDSSNKINKETTPTVESKSVTMGFNECLSAKTRVIAGLNINPSNIDEIVNSSIATITRVYTADGSVLITCSKPDSKMVITYSNRQK